MTARFYGNGRVGAGRRDARRRSAPGWRVHWAGSRHTSGHTASILRDEFLCARAILTPSVSLPPFDVYVLLFSLHALSSPPRSSLPPQPPSAPPRPSFCTPPHTLSYSSPSPQHQGRNNAALSEKLDGDGGGGRSLAFRTEKEERFVDE